MSEEEDELHYQRYKRHRERYREEAADERKRAADQAELEELRAKVATPPPPPSGEHEPEI